LITETSSKPHESPVIKKEKSSLEKTENDESPIDALRDIRNNTEQIREIGQSLATMSREIANGLTKVLKLSNRTLQLDDFDGQEIDVHPDGFILIREKDGNVTPRPLVDLEPPFLHAIIKQLLPKLKVGLDEVKQEEEHMLDELSKVHENLA
jgi:hypothetical protein